jgi:hypothetical protein
MSELPRNQTASTPVVVYAGIVSGTSRRTPDVTSTDCSTPPGCGPAWSRSPSRSTARPAVPGPTSSRPSDAELISGAGGQIRDGPAPVCLLRRRVLFVRTGGARLCGNEPALGQLVRAAADLALREVEEGGRPEAVAGPGRVLLALDLRDQLRCFAGAEVQPDHFRALVLRSLRRSVGVPAEANCTAPWARPTPRPDTSRTTTQPTSRRSRSRQRGAELALGCDCLRAEGGTEQVKAGASGEAPAFTVAGLPPEPKGEPRFSRQLTPKSLTNE